MFGSTLQGMVETFGVPIAMLIYFIWRDWHQARKAEEREKDLIVRLQTLEDYQKKELQELIVTSHDALSKASCAQVEAAKSLHELVKMLQGRPCFADPVTRDMINKAKY